MWREIRPTRMWVGGHLSGWRLLFWLGWVVMLASLALIAHGGGQALQLIFEDADEATVAAFTVSMGVGLLFGGYWLARFAKRRDFHSYRPKFY